VASKNVNPAAYSEYGFENSVGDSEQIKKKMFNIHANLFPSNFTQMKQVDSTWLAKSKATIANWKPIGVVGVVNNIESNTAKWKDELVTLSSQREKGEQAENFNFNLSFDDVKTKFKTLDSPTPLAIGLAVGLYVLMLISYLVSKQHTKNIIKKRKSGYDIDF
jgi:hypothetical protein